MRTPLVVVSGISPEAVSSLMVSLMWDLPNAVAVQHCIDPESQVLTRTVSDRSGRLDLHGVPLEHACATCALREDIVPTLESLAKQARWGAIVACLPVGMEAEHLAEILAGDTRLARRLKLASVITALDAGTAVDDLLGPDLLAERGLHTGPHDDRGVAEVACQLVEYADVIVTGPDPQPEAVDLIQALTRPDALIVEGPETLDGAAVTTMVHKQMRAAAWSVPLGRDKLPDLTEGSAWRLDLSSDQPLDPDRLLDEIEQLGSGRHRIRGCFWVATRPGVAQLWKGAGGQVSIGSHSAWGDRQPLTRLVVTGLGAPPVELFASFQSLLGSADSAPHGQLRWAPQEDGLEPWLGPIRGAA